MKKIILIVVVGICLIMAAANAIEKIDITKFPARDKHESYYKAIVSGNEAIDKINDLTVTMEATIKKLNEVIDTYNTEHGSTIAKVVNQ